MSLPSASLHVHRRLGREHMRAAVQVRLKEHPLLRYFPESIQAEDLKSAGIGEDRPGPVHESMQSAESVHRFVSRPEI